MISWRIGSEGRFQQGVLYRQPPTVLAGTATVSAGRRFEVYAGAYRLRLTEALKANHPVLHQALGDEQFDRLALAYLEAHPSVSATFAGLVIGWMISSAFTMNCFPIPRWRI